MQTRLKIIFLILIACCTQQLFAWDTDIQFRETSYYLRDVSLIGQVGWAVGEPHWDQSQKVWMSTILKTTDTGKNWTVQNCEINAILYGVSFVDANTGWAVGENGTILHTSNGGQNWIKQTVATTHIFRGVVFTSASHGWATCIEPIHNAFMGYGDDWRSVIWHTSNGGDSWTPQTLPDDASLLNRIDFVDTQNGWAVGVKISGSRDDFFIDHVAAVYQTTNGGDTWTELYSPDLDIVFTGVDFIDSDTGWIVGFKGNSGVQGGTIFHTANGGSDWSRQEPDDVLWDVQFINSQKGYAAGCMYGAAWGPPVYRTSNGGADWEKIHMDKHDGEGLYGIAVSESNVVAVGDYSYVCTSSDPWGTYGWPHGENLFSQTYLSTHYQFLDVFFTSETNGWIVGRKKTEPSMWGQVILHTTNSGKEWETQYDNPPPEGGLFSYNRLDAVFFVDQQNGWAVGTSEDRKNAILHTTNEGQTWTDQSGELHDSWDLEFVDVFFLDNENGWALAESRFPSRNIFLAHTTNGGDNWTWVDTGIDGSMCIGFEIVQGGLDFTDPSHCWITGGQGNAIQTTNGGTSWSAKTLPSQYTNCHKIDFIDSQHGWIVGEQIYYTENSGMSWTTQDVGYDQYFYDLEFLNLQEGWMVGSYGRIIHTTNGGSSWDDVTTTTANSLRSVHFPTPSGGWAAGDNGIIVRIDSDENSSVETPDFASDAAPQTFRLLPNHPNPFNAETRIQYEMVHNGHLVIQIFNTMGRHITTLFKGYQNSGVHEIHWHADDLPSGLYICRMQTGHFQTSQKLILQK